MFLVELVLQGVRGTRELARLRFRDGFNLVSAGNESGKTTAVDAMQRLLFPRSGSGLLETLVSRHTPEASRAALVMFSDDGAYYRIIQDFSKRAVNLSRYNTGTKDFTLLHKDWDSAVQFMTGLTSGMSEEDFARIFILRRDHYAGLSAASAPAPAPIPHAQPARPAVPPGAKGKTSADQAKLAALRETLKKAEEAADAEYRAQSARLALDDIKKKLAGLDEIDQKKEEIDSTLAGLKGCETLPENLPELLDDHERRSSQKMADADELNKELESLKTQLSGMPTQNLLTDKLFIVGAALGTLSILAGVFVLTAEQALYFPIGILLSLGIMAAAWYNGSRKNAQRNSVMKEAEKVEQEVADLEKRFEQEGAALTTLMKATGSSTAAELKEKADNYRYFLSMREDIEERQRRTAGELTPEILRQEYDKQQQTVTELEKAARAVAQYNVDTYGIRQDIERLEGASAGASGDFGADVSELTADFPVPATGVRQAGFHEELGIASRIGGIEMETLVPAVEAAAQRNLSAVTNDRYVRIEVGQDGVPPIVYAKNDSPVSCTELSHGTRDLVYFCLRAGLLEALAGKRRLPFILDDPFAGLDPARQKTAAQILRALGAKTQVVLFTSNPALRAEGDAAAELK